MPHRIDAEADIGEDDAVLLRAGNEEGPGGVDPAVIADIAMVGVAGDAVTCLMPGTAAAGHSLSIEQLIVQMER